MHDRHQGQELAVTVTGGIMTKKRANGEGSVFKRKDGRVVGVYEDANGKSRYISSKTMTKAEMKAAVRKKLQERDEGIVHDSEGLTVERYMERWLESIRGNVRPGTYKPYEAIVRLHIKPTLGSIKLDKLNAMQLEKLYRQKLDSGLSARRVRYIHVTIRKALKDAVRLQVLSRNIADAAIPPRQTKTEIEPLTQDQMRSLLDVAKGDKLHAFYVLAITTGMRQGELLGLQWKDVDLDSGTLRVNRSVYEGVVSPPKTNAGRRIIRLSRLAQSALSGLDPLWWTPESLEAKPPRRESTCRKVRGTATRRSSRPRRFSWPAPLLRDPSVSSPMSWASRIRLYATGSSKHRSIAASARA
jgi:integrase